MNRKEIIKEAKEEDYKIPSDLALDNTELLMDRMSNILPDKYEIYPTTDGTVAIHFVGGRGHSVIIECESEGEVVCFVHNDGRHRRARYCDVQGLPDGFIGEALDEINRKVNND